MYVLCVCVRSSIYMYYKITSCELRTSKNITRSCFLFHTFKKYFSGVSVSFKKIFLGLLLSELWGLVIGITIYNQAKIICLHVLIHGLLKKSNDSSRALHWDPSNNWLPRVGSTPMSTAHMTVWGVLFSWKSFRVPLEEFLVVPSLHLIYMAEGTISQQVTLKSLAFLPPLGRRLPQRHGCVSKIRLLWFTPLTGVARSHLLFPLHRSSGEQPLCWLQLTGHSR